MTIAHRCKGESHCTVCLRGDLFQSTLRVASLERRVALLENERAVTEANIPQDILDLLTRKGFVLRKVA